MKTFSDISLISVWGLLGCSYAVYLYILLRRGIKNHLKSTILNFIWGSAARSAWRSFKNRPRTTPYTRRLEKVSKMDDFERKMGT